jgi:hypothetical protein
LISVILLLLVAFIFLLYYIDKNGKEKQSLSAFMLRDKCLSLCPTALLSGKTEKTIRVFDRSCSFGCARHLEGIDTTYQPANSLEESFALAYSNCTRQMLSNPDFDYKLCFNETFNNFTSLRDLSDYEMEPYMIYNLDVEIFVCYNNRAEATVKYLEGNDSSGEVAFLFENSDLSVKIINFTAPDLGESKHYIINYTASNLNFDHTNATIQIWFRQNRNLLWEMWKDC